MENFATIVKGLKDLTFLFSHFFAVPLKVLWWQHWKYYTFILTCLRYHKRFYEGNNENTTFLFSHFFVIPQKVLWRQQWKYSTFIFTLPCGIAKGFVKSTMEILDFYFHRSLWCHKRFHEGNHGNTRFLIFTILCGAAKSFMKVTIEILE